jgi:hypothetical protein
VDDEGGLICGVNFHIRFLLLLVGHGEQFSLLLRRVSNQTAARSISRAVRVRA